MFSKNSFWLLLVLAAGAIIGGLLGESLETTKPFGAATDFLVRKYQVLQVPPVDMDLYIAKVSLGLTFSPNLVAILGMILGAILFNKF